jgi:putative ABC transport system permease protein
VRIRAPRVVRRLVALVTWNTRDRDMDREMTFHLESIAREYVRSGMSEEDAALAARRRFGSVVRLKEQGHDVRSVRVIEDLVRDARHMGRGLRRSPGFAIAVVLTLAIGIGANTAIFSVVDQLLLRPLPYPDGDELVKVSEVVATGAPEVSPANWLDWQRESRAFRALAAWRIAPDGVTLTGVGEPTQLNAQIVSAEFFSVLGVGPALGRTLSEGDDRPNSPRVLVLSHRLWQQRFGGDPNVIGRLVQVNDRPAEIVGVMPANFAFVYPDNDVWAAFRLNRNEPWRQTAGRFLHVVGRLEQRSTLAAARTELEAIARRLAREYEFNKNTSVKLVPLREELTGQVHTALVALYGAVVLLLVIACLNVANLLLARSASRRREIAIRISLGAGRVAIIRQLLVESLLLSIAGGALGVALACWSLDALLAASPVDLLRVPGLSVDARVLLYALGLALSTGVIVGLVPAVAVLRHSVVASMRMRGSTVTHATRVRQTLVVGQVAMTVVLLCGAGLLVRTVVGMNRADSGFDKQDLLMMDVTLPGARYTEEQEMAFYRQAVAALRTLPGVSSATAASSLPVIQSPKARAEFHVLGTAELPISDRPTAVIRIVMPGYFRTLRIPVLQGREFSDADDASPAPGVVINEAFAKAFLSNVEPLTVSLTVRFREQPYAPVIGVVGDVREGSIRDSAQPTVFYANRQVPQDMMTLLVRAPHAEMLARPAVAALHALDPNLPVTNVRTVESAFAESVVRERLSAMVSGAFALSGLLVASLGLYALLAFFVTERTKEIGLRIALGAHVSRVTRSVVGGGLRLVGIGAVVGVGLSMLLLRSLGALLYGVTMYDPSTYMGVVTLLCAVGGLASYVPGRRAARVDPHVALRQD